MTNPRALTSQVTDTIHRLFTTTQLLPTAITKITQALPGYPTGGNTYSGSTLNQDGTPAGLDKHLTDQVAREHKELQTLIARLHADSIRLAHITTQWTTTAEQADSTGADCEACNAHITKPDRLRAGLCNACRMNWQRWKQTNNGDRHQWLWERRKTVEQRG